MIDSVLKGTGNSRFLKSAVPVGTSWADALAMLQAGTFPIDFNGINTEGFQQVGTPLNKANLLKDATAAQIGLPPSTTPDGMFQALGNTGELHVWRKTVVTGTDIPAGYNVTDTTGVISSGVYGYTDLTITYSDAVDVNDTGGVTLREPTTTYTTTATGFVNKTSEEPKFLSGKFFTVNLLNAPIMYQKPTESWNFSFTTSYVSFNSGYVVKGYPLTPAGTTTTYPVSTNPKAYQEGDDAKAATYVLGDVAQQFLGANSAVGSGVQMGTYYSSSVSVADDGTVSLVGEQESVWTLNSSGSAASNIQATLRGKYFRCVGYSGVKAPSGIFYMPNDAVVAYDNTGAISGSETRFCYYADRVARVTGQATIPAGTTIEYLGKLGDKARVQVVSYVGTGVSGSANPTTVTFDFVPKIVIAHCQNNEQYRFIAPYGIEYTLVRNSLNDNALTITWKNKTMSYQNNSPGLQMNTSGVTYIVVAIG